MKTNKKTIEEKALQICYDRYLCEKVGLDYNNPDYVKAVIYVLKQELK